MTDEELREKYCGAYKYLNGKGYTTCGVWQGRWAWQNRLRCLKKKLLWEF